MNKHQLNKTKVVSTKPESRIFDHKSFTQITHIKHSQKN